VVKAESNSKIVMQLINYHKKATEAVKKTVNTYV
jgi:hypothetical protein